MAQQQFPGLPSNDHDDCRDVINANATDAETRLAALEAASGGGSTDLSVVYNSTDQSSGLGTGGTVNLDTVNGDGSVVADQITVPDGHKALFEYSPYCEFASAVSGFARYGIYNVSDAQFEGRFGQQIPNNKSDAIMPNQVARAVIYASGGDKVVEVRIDASTDLSKIIALRSSLKVIEVTA